MRVLEKVVFESDAKRNKFVSLIYRYDISDNFKRFDLDGRRVIEFHLPRSWDFSKTKAFIEEFEKAFPKALHDQNVL